MLNERVKNKLFHQSVLAYRRALYFKVALFFVAAAVLIYLLPLAGQPASGNSWQGYLLGTISALLVVWLMLLGIRKRSYSSNMGTTQGWVSAHIYLGAALLIVASLHNGFQFGPNVHSFTYVLLILVVVSGFVGLVLYLKAPNSLAHSLGGSDVDVLLKNLASLDEKAVALSAACDVDVQLVTVSAIERSSLPLSIYARLRAKDASKVVMPKINSDGVRGEPRTVANKNQAAVLDFFAHQVPYSIRSEESTSLQALLNVFMQRKIILSRLRSYAQLTTALKLWLLFHVPLSFGLLAALLVHVFVVFYYW